MPNALADSASPYLRQHAGNPVDWRPWGEAAFAEARRRQVPVLVSIGYSTCHWCHVMAHESFEDAETAQLMNEALVCVKVDREEHPEVDAIYMDAVQALTGRGGWPLNAFTDDRGRPFYACTYLPTEAWRGLVAHLARLWGDDRARIDRAAADITAHLLSERTTTGVLDDDVWLRCAAQLERTWDADHPGFCWSAERQPKFPANQILPLLLTAGDAAWRTRAVRSLEAMQDGGIHDRVGGGFHRYSVDRFWRVPHFEKMLYDNAQLAVAYARAGLAHGRADFLRTAAGIGDWLLNDMRVTAPDGAFLGYATAEDADDPGGEGSFYAWSPAQLVAVLGAEDGARVAAAWDLSLGAAEVGPGGHAEPVTTHIPHPRSGGLLAARDAAAAEALRVWWEPFLPRLRAARAARPRPHRDDKVLTDQNALALEAFAWLARATGAERFHAACSELSDVLRARHGADGLLRLPGRPALASDYGCLVAGLAEAWNLLGDERLLAAATRAAVEADARLVADDGGLFTAPDGRSDLIRRGRERTDHAMPAGPGALALGLARLAAITGETRWRDRARALVAADAPAAAEAPAACATLLTAHLLLTRGPLTAKVPSSALAVARRHPGVHAVVAAAEPAQVCVGDRCLAAPGVAAALDAAAAELAVIRSG
jgi:hypothetical protein